MSLLSAELYTSLTASVTIHWVHQQQCMTINNSIQYSTDCTVQYSGLFLSVRQSVAHTSLSRCVSVRPKLHYTDTGYGHCQRRTHNNSTTNLPHRNARAQHLEMSRCWDVANFCLLVVNLLWARSLAVFVAGVRVVEFGSKPSQKLPYC